MENNITEKVKKIIDEFEEYKEKLEIQEEKEREEKNKHIAGMEDILLIIALILIVEFAFIYIFAMDKSILNVLAKIIQAQVSFPVTILNTIIAIVSGSQLISIYKYTKKEKAIDERIELVNKKITQYNAKLNKQKENNKEIENNKTKKMIIKPIKQVQTDINVKKLQKRAR